MISEERRRLGAVSDVFDSIDLVFGTLKSRVKEAVKPCAPYSRDEIAMYTRIIEGTIKTGQKLIVQLLTDIDELKAQQGRARRSSELAGSLASLDALSKILEQQRVIYEAEIIALDEKMRMGKSKIRKRSTDR